MQELPESVKQMVGSVYTMSRKGEESRQSSEDLLSNEDLLSKATNSSEELAVSD
jgi:hypothetical protein